MRSVFLSIAATGIALVLSGCGRVVLVDCDDIPNPGTGTAWPVTCEADLPVFCRDPDTGERCIPQATECRLDGEARCLSESGVEEPSLEVVCLSGDVDVDEILRTTPTCTELLTPPEGEEDL